MAKRSKYWLTAPKSKPSTGAGQQLSQPARLPLSDALPLIGSKPLPDRIRPEEAEFCRLADEAFARHLQGFCDGYCPICADLREIDAPSYREELRRIRRPREQQNDATKRRDAIRVRPDRDLNRGLGGPLAAH